MTRQIQLYDTTLRDGMQGMGVSLSAAEKLSVARRLDDLGIHFIEAGFPSSNPKELEFFELLSSESFENSTVCAFGMTRRRDVAARRRSRAAAARSAASLRSARSWARPGSCTSRRSSTRIPRRTCASSPSRSPFCAREGKRVVYDAEHFFDGYREDADYALRCLHAALEAGAENVALCDTNGASLQPDVAEATARVVRECGGERVGIHTHNDAECAVANSIVAVEEGATMVQGTMNGVGERCGNANLVSILPSLQIKLGYRCVSDEQLANLTEAAHYVDEVCNLTPDPNQPYVGRNAFAHGGGMHVAGVRADARTFEHIDPDGRGQPARAAGLGALRQGNGARAR